MVGPENTDLQLGFPRLNAATLKKKEPINYLINNHLRAQHPAIDGVCVALGSNSKRYFLLLQVSLSEHKCHTSKGIHIKLDGSHNTVNLLFLVVAYGLWLMYRAPPAEWA